MLRPSPWRLAGFGIVLASAVGVAASIGCGIAYGALWGVGAYVATTALLLGAIMLAARLAPPAPSEAEPWRVAEGAPPAGIAGEQRPETAEPVAADGRPARRLSDKIAGAFEHACRTHDVALAEKLLESLEMLLLREPSAVEERTLKLEAVIAGRNRLAALRREHGATQAGAAANAGAET